ncbi:DUF6600 domain-containing protein [Dyella subtropica]|uniref:DUF6600 domain-containing protein n=1 Tax=Dyella subtropica TaxID=2992127 RepID=UPI002254CAFC|nr:DUF6600 domain-containing protein [Dyella subtropica]
MRISFPFIPRNWALLAASLLLCAAGLAQAQSDGDAGDPPSRVARLSFLSGDLGFLPAGAKDWSDASVNRPLTNGDRLSTGSHGKAELELGGGSLRMAQNTNFGFLDLNDQMAQVELTQGTLNLAVRNLGQGQSYEIDTPTVALVVDRPGTFRVDVDRNGRTTEVTAFRGRATVYGENGAQRQVDAGTRYEFDDSSLNNVTLNDLGGGGDAFDDWCYERDQRYTRSPSRRYVSEEVVGYQDLDQYGDWRSDPEYGAVWYPARVAVDWAPYRDGHWAYVAPWGWTWVDDSPWGFAPYHYGRWAYVSGAWGWVPGPVEVRPVYAPALVAFVGGNNWSVSIGVGGGAPVGWFPLGPRDVYNPWYRASRNYYTNVNVTNINVHNTYNRTTVINNINNQYNYFRNGQPQPRIAYANREVPHALTAVSGQNFASAQNVRRNLVQMDPHQLAAAPVLPRGVNIRPNQASFAPPRNPQAQPLPVSGFQREVVARHAPPANFANRQTIQPDSARPTGFAQRPAIGAPTPAVGMPSNVRLLNAQAGPGRSAPGNETTVPARLPPVGNRQTPTMAAPATAADVNPRRAEAADRPAMRPNELPSARFVHPNANADAAAQNPRNHPPVPQNEAPRPGVSYIPNAQDDRARAAQQAAPAQPRGTLPDVAHYNRVTEQPPAAQPEIRNPRGVNTPIESRPNPAVDRAEPMPQRAGRDYGNLRVDNPAPRPEYQTQRPEPQPRMEPSRMREPPPAIEQRAYQPPPRPQPMPQPQPQPMQQQMPHNNPPPPHEQPHAAPPQNRDDHRPRNKDDQHN